MRLLQRASGFSLSQFWSSSVCCLCATTNKLFIDLFLWEDEVCIEWFVATALAGRPVLNAWKNLSAHGEEILLFNAFYESLTSWWSTSHSVLTVQHCTLSVPARPPLNQFEPAFHDSASFRTLQHSALSLQLDQYYQKGNRCCWDRHTHISPAQRL